MPEDLCTDIIQWRKLGNQNVLIIELKEKITSEIITEIFAYVGFMEGITHRHHATGLVPTHKRESHHIGGKYTSITFYVSADS